MLSYSQHKCVQIDVWYLYPQMYVNAQLQLFLSNVFVCEYVCVGRMYRRVDMGVVDVGVCVCVKEIKKERQTERESLAQLVW